MGGDDGHLYELQYQVRNEHEVTHLWNYNCSYHQNSSRLFGIWGRSKCSKINHTNTMTRLWTSMSSFFGRDAECMQHLAYYEDAGSVGNGMLYALVIITHTMVGAHKKSCKSRCHKNQLEHSLKCSKC